MDISVFFQNCWRCFQIYRFYPDLLGFFGEIIAALTGQHGPTPFKSSQMPKNELRGIESRFACQVPK